AMPPRESRRRGSAPGPGAALLDQREAPLSEATVGAACLIGDDKPLSDQVEQRFGLGQVPGRKTFGKPLIDACQQIPGLRGPAVGVPEASETDRAAQLPRPCVLTAADVERTQEQALRLLPCRRLSAGEQLLASGSKRLGGTPVDLAAG